MNLISISYYMLLSLVLVVSGILSLRCLFVNQMRLEAWHEPVHYRRRMPLSTFKWLVHLTGWASLAVFMLTVYWQFAAV